MQKSRGCTYFFPQLHPNIKGEDETRLTFRWSLTVRRKRPVVSVMWCIHVYFITSVWNTSSSVHQNTSDERLITGPERPRPRRPRVWSPAARPPARFSPTTGGPLSSLNSCFTAVCIMDDSRDEYSRIINVRLTDSDVSYGRLYFRVAVSWGLSLKAIHKCHSPVTINYYTGNWLEDFLCYLSRLFTGVSLSVQTERARANVRPSASLWGVLYFAGVSGGRARLCEWGLFEKTHLKALLLW